MKVCLVNTYDSTGGAAIACRRLMHAMNQRSDIKAKMIVASGKTEDENIIRLDRSLLRKWHFNLNLVQERFYFKPHHNGEINEFYFSPANTGMNISQHPAIQEADIIHLHWINLGFLSVKGIKKLIKTGKPIVWTLHDMWAFTGGCHYSGDCTNYRNGCGHCMFLKKAGPSDLSVQLNQQKTFFEQLQFVTCSNWLKEEALKSSLLSRANVTSIPNTIDTNIFQPGDRTKSRSNLQLDPSKKYILFGAANLDDKRKGFAYLMKALDMLSADVKDSAELLLFGKNTMDNSALPLKVNSLGALSAMEAIADAYRSADLFVIPSLQDNLPNTIMESMACGTPVVGFNSGGIPEMIDHKVNGYIAEFKQEQDLADGMKYVLDHPELGEKARQKVMDTYQSEMVTTQYLEIYRSLLK